MNRRKSRLLIFIILSGFILGLSAFQQPLTGADKPKTDTLQVKLPVNFPKPVYDFERNPVTRSGFELGKTLFYAQVLSSDQSVSCSSCHRASGAFANFDVPLSKGVKDCLGERNAPPLFNLAWQKEFMWDGRIKHLADVPVNAITSTCEMNSNLDSLVARISHDPTYSLLFNQAFGHTGITSENILKALAQFTSMMISANSRYDSFIRKEADGDLTPDEQSGYTLFKQKCSTCHTEPLFTDGSYRNNGLDEFSRDSGRDSLTHISTDKGKFRVPSLRNVEITRPYMHDGRFSSLKQVLQHYNGNVKNHANLDPVLKKNGKLGIPLSDPEQTRIIAFLKTLTDVDFINDRRFNNH